MPLLSVDSLDFSVGHRALLNKVQLTVESGERIALIGRNGMGKSTFLKILAGQARADAGEVRLAPGSRIAYLQQDPPLDDRASVYQTIASPLGPIESLLTGYHHCINRVAAGDEAALTELARWQHEIDAVDGWSIAQRMDEILSRLELDPDASLADLSGGAKRRVLLGQALIQNPDVLLLDEPTNHLDIGRIEWLEALVREFRGAVIFITHDRSFLKRLATRILELDRGELTSWPGDYDNYLRRREERDHAESIQNAEFDKFLAEEEVWIRQGVKARRTRNEGRVRRLEALRAERAQRVAQQGNISLSLGQANVSGKIVFEGEHLTHRYGEQTILHDFSLKILRGDRIGLVGPNGVGKSTLIRLTLGQITPDQGRVRLGTQLNIAYFDQHRAELRPDWTALENLCEGGDRLMVRGHNTHGIGYLQQFLFTPDRARTKVEALSGGERNRLLLAKLFAEPANLLVLDEPTNDLDLETLEVLEQALLDLDGTLLVVSHDRAFLDQITTSLLVFEGEGRVREVIGGYEDWLALRDHASAPAPAPAPKLSVKPATNAAPPPPRASASSPRAELSFKEKHELARLPDDIARQEAVVEQLNAEVNRPDFYQRPTPETTALLARLTDESERLEQLIERWSILEARAEGSA
ncbi:ATP-binding cassette domain-containing protein [Halothiobacillus sp. DCM-1]|uniref:ATP-binding cassette domain-containing protein n=1 Tax=Halothiobacillus sp. DCM-1 TaxID=3112558 RepID=UPI00324D1F18